MVDLSKQAEAWKARKAFYKKQYPDPKMGTKAPKLGTPDLPDYDPLIDNYPEEIHHRLINPAMQGGSYMREGWYDLVRDLDDAISKIYPFYVIDQVKEKFGSLRYYISGLPDDFPAGHRKQINDLIHEAQKLSITTCDICGEAGEMVLIDNSLVAVRCKKHDNDR